MNLDTALFYFGITSLILVITIFMIYSCFGPGAENLIDPFEEDNA